MKRFVLLILLILFIIICAKASNTAVTTDIPRKTKKALATCDGLPAFENDEEEREKLNDVKYIWKFRGIPIEKLCRFKNRTVISSYGDLLIDNFNNGDHGTYSCTVVFNQSGIQIEDSVKKKIGDKHVLPDNRCSPNFCVAAKECYRSSLPNVCSNRGEICCNNFATCESNDSALVPCKRTKDKSSNNLSYHWAHGSSKSPLSDHPDMKGRTSVTGAGELLINRFTEKDYGKYTCVIKSGDSVVEKLSVDVDNTYRLATENCHPSGCITAAKCHSTGNKLSCPADGEVCCSVVRDEDKYLCRHFLGECMETCSSSILTRDNAKDCKDGTTCCVLV